MSRNPSWMGMLRIPRLRISAKEFPGCAWRASVYILSTPFDLHGLAPRRLTPVHFPRSAQRFDSSPLIPRLTSPRGDFVTFRHRHHQIQARPHEDHADIIAFSQPGQPDHSVTLALATRSLGSAAYNHELDIPAFATSPWVFMYAPRTQPSISSGEQSSHRTPRSPVAVSPSGIPVPFPFVRPPRVAWTETSVILLQIKVGSG
ncbi:hypothetical protein DFH09DRAFT_1305645 [Mycena vulgaris]|nr:hypothetical protein DFH09DRAFT_1305645 [Mycena vulgaris]